MSGHNKWAQIKHKKAVTDKKRAQIFSKLSRLITVAARKGADPKSNISLSQAIEQARAMNMPNDNIERAIKRVVDKSDSVLEELNIEALGPNGIAIKIKAITDNKNRTISEIKNILSKNNSKMVPPGSIAWMFNQPQQEVSDPDVLKNINALLEVLDDNDDVEDVSLNLKD